MRRCLLALLVVAAVVPLGSQSRADEGPSLSEPLAALADSLRCFPAQTHAHDPVLLVHGTTVTAEENWWWNYVPPMNAAGFDVCTVDLPDRAMVDIQRSSEYVVYGVRAISSRTGRKVDLMGLSQGGLEPRWAVRWWPDVRERVDDLVDIVTPNHGFGGADFLCMNACPEAIWQMKGSSAFIGALNATDETPGDIDYTSIYSLTDPVVNPQLPESVSKLDGATNIAVQDVCPGRPVDHAQSAVDAVVWRLVLDAFTHAGTASIARIDHHACVETFLPGIDPVEFAEREAAVYAYGFPMAMGLTYPPVPAEPPLRCYATPAGCPA
jgi:pimeloyl-ACP methyl ester carboxylesterase